MNQQRAAYERLTIPELKQHLRARNMKVGGRKAELVDRLMGVGVVAPQAAPQVAVPQTETMYFQGGLPAITVRSPRAAPRAPRAAPRAVSPRAKAVKKIARGRSLKADLETLTTEKLKAILKKRKLKVSGKKAELVDRILKDNRKRKEKGPVDTNVPARKRDLEKLSIPVLKDILRARRQKVSGKKAELVDRILSGEGIGSQKVRPKKK